MFRKALIKMTLFYLLILMSISLLFSIALYRISTQEIKGSLQRQQRNFEKVGPFMRDFLEDSSIRELRQEDYESANKRIFWQLVYTNIVILVIGGGLSYYLAILTIEPIERAHDAQARFTGDASHELRSPLASMKAEIEVALRDPKLKREEAIEILKSNLEEVERLSLLSGYLLDLAKEDGTPLKISNININDFVNGAVDVVSVKAEKSEVKIKKEINPDLRAQGNPESLKDLLVILLDNAIKFSEKGGIVTVSAKKVGRSVEVSIADRGVGIKETDIPHIFERFYRAEQSRCKNKVEGYGLGLALAQKIAEANHGQISVKSKVGVGSTFCVKLNV